MMFATFVRVMLIKPWILFQAYRKWVAKYGEEPALPGLNMTHDQVRSSLADSINLS